MGDSALTLRGNYLFLFFFIMDMVTWSDDNKSILSKHNDYRCIYDTPRVFLTVVS